jgi:transposase
MAADAWDQAQPGHLVPGARPGGLDTKKKTVYASEQDAEARAAWRVHADTLDPAAFVFLDETSTTRNMTRRYARAPANTRAIAYTPRNYGQRTTLIAALRPTGLEAPMLLEGAIDTEAFVAYVERCLCPVLQAGQVVIMDNLSSHRDGRVRALIEAAGCTLWFLPTYSPDYNPIEYAFSKVKEWLRAVAARTQEALDQPIVEALAHITKQDIRGWFSRCGYVLP